MSPVNATGPVTRNQELAPPALNVHAEKMSPVPVIEPARRASPVVSKPSLPPARTTLLETMPFLRSHRKFELTFQGKRKSVRPVGTVIVDISGVESGFPAVSVESKIARS